MAEIPIAPLIKMESIILNPTIPKIYANGFSIGFTASDAHIILQLNSIPIAVINLSIITAKTLQKSLTTTIGDFEKQTGIQFNDIFEIQEGLQKNQNK